jgi:CRISPR system Cascade subunit CasC
MSQFIQLHMLTSYPPSNLNRDDLGRPKTATMGGADRLRISSQSLKRAWRTSALFEEALSGHIGTRTKRIGIKVRNRMQNKGIDEKKAGEWAAKIAAQFGKLKASKGKKKADDESLEIEQLAHISPEEWDAVDALIDVLAAENRAPEDEELKLLRNRVKAADIAFFGRMLASSPEFNVEAAVQVSHALTVNASAVEDDYFTAVDDLNEGLEDRGAGHVGESAFGSGVFYVYVCINRDQLVDNLAGDEALANKALAAFVETAAKISPSGKQNSFASRAYASYILAERGTQQPRSLSVAFLKPVRGQDFLTEAVQALEKQREKMDAAYGACADGFQIMNVETGAGTLNEIIEFVRG